MRKMGCTHPRKMCASQAQGKIGLCAIRKQSGKLASADVAAATPEAHVFSGNLSRILCLFIGWVQVVTLPHAPVECAQPKHAARTPVGSGPRSLECHQIFGCTHPTPPRGLIDKGKDPPVRGPKVVAQGAF